MHEASENHLFLRSSFGHIDMLDPALVPFLRDIEPAITAPELPDIRPAVCAGADYIPVLLVAARRKPARAGHIAIAILVQEETLEELEDGIPVHVEEIPEGFLVSAEGIMQLPCIH